MQRRRLLAGLAAATLGPPVRATDGGGAPALLGQARQTVLIVGGGWGGLSSAHALRRLAPELDLLLVDRESVFRALPLSSAWLVGRTPERLPRIDLAAQARAQGWRFLAAEVRSIDRARRRLDTSAGTLTYDWLVLATGAGYEDAGWFGGDPAAAAEAQARFPAGFQASELDRLQRALQGFEGGELVMSIPPPPYRCPPAPYERAVLLGWWIRRRGLRARLTLLDAGAGMPRYTRLFAERWRGVIEHRPHSEVRRVDPWARTVSTDDGELRFDHALLLPPMGAGPLLAQAGLLGQDAGGRPTRWAAVDPASLRSPHDERIYLVGDALDSVSILFGAYPKTAQVAADLGAAAARHLAASSRGERVPDAASALPSSQCHVWLDAEPAEQLRIETHYRLRGDGVITQAVRQVDNPQPRDEDLHWARGVMRTRLGVGLS